MNPIPQHSLRFSRTMAALLTALALLVSCEPPALYERNMPVDPAGWNIADSVAFEVPIGDTVNSMKFTLSLRHNADYAYSNIYFFLSTWYPDQRYSRDTIQLLLAGKDGKWFGRGFGKLKEVEVVLKDRVVFPMKGTYRFSFVQAMRTESLEGVEDIGVRIEKADD